MSNSRDNKKGKEKVREDDVPEIEGNAEVVGDAENNTDYRYVYDLDHFRQTNIFGTNYAEEKSLDFFHVGEVGEEVNKGKPFSEIPGVVQFIKDCVERNFKVNGVKQLGLNISEISDWRKWANHINATSALTVEDEVKLDELKKLIAIALGLLKPDDPSQNLDNTSKEIATQLICSMTQMVAGFANSTIRQVIVDTNTINNQGVSSRENIPGKTQPQNSDINFFYEEGRGLYLRVKESSYVITNTEYDSKARDNWQAIIQAEVEVISKLISCEKTSTNIEHSLGFQLQSVKTNSPIIANIFRGQYSDKPMSQAHIRFIEALSDCDLCLKKVEKNNDKLGLVQRVSKLRQVIIDIYAAHIPADSFINDAELSLLTRLLDTMTEGKEQDLNEVEACVQALADFNRALFDQTPKDKAKVQTTETGDESGANTPEESSSPTGSPPSTTFPMPTPSLRLESHDGDSEGKAGGDQENQPASSVESDVGDSQQEMKVNLGYAAASRAKQIILSTFDDRKLELSRVSRTLRFFSSSLTVGNQNQEECYSAFYKQLETLLAQYDQFNENKEEQAKARVKIAAFLSAYTSLYQVQIDLTAALSKDQPNQDLQKLLTSITTIIEETNKLIQDPTTRLDDLVRTELSLFKISDYVTSYQSYMQENTATNLGGLQQKENELMQTTSELKDKKFNGIRFAILSLVFVISASVLVASAIAIALSCGAATPIAALTGTAGLAGLAVSTGFLSLGAVGSAIGLSGLAASSLFTPKVMQPKNPATYRFAKEVEKHHVSAPKSSK